MMLLFEVTRPLPPPFPAAKASPRRIPFTFLRVQGGHQWVNRAAQFNTLVFPGLVSDLSQSFPCLRTQELCLLFFN